MIFAWSLRLHLVCGISNSLVINKTIFCGKINVHILQRTRKLEFLLRRSYSNCNRQNYFAIRFLNSVRIRNDNKRKEVGFWTLRIRQKCSAYKRTFATCLNDDDSRIASVCFSSIEPPLNSYYYISDYVGVASNQPHSFYPLWWVVDPLLDFHFFSSRFNRLFFSCFICLFCCPLDFHYDCLLSKMVVEFTI